MRRRQRIARCTRARWNAAEPLRALRPSEVAGSAAALAVGLKVLDDLAASGGEGVDGCGGDAGDPDADLALSDTEAGGQLPAQPGLVEVPDRAPRQVGRPRLICKPVTRCHADRYASWGPSRGSEGPGPTTIRQPAPRHGANARAMRKNR